MVIGVPKEIKNNEYRVGMTPAGVKAFVAKGHSVLVESKAGEGSNFFDEEYLKAGATILNSAAEIYSQSKMIVKVKEPLKAEYPLIQKNQTLFTYFHFAASEDLTKAMINSDAICIAYETVEKEDRSLPLLVPMSEIAGKMSIQQGAKYLEKPLGGKGVLLGGVPGVEPGNVLVIGAGLVGLNAALMAAGLGANVKIMDVNVDRLRYLENFLPANITTVISNEENIEKLLPSTDLVIGAVLVPGAIAPKVIRRHHLKLMVKGSVVVDVAIDQGGCFETSRVTSHSDPIYTEEGIIHYCVANIPGAVPFTSTKALTNVTLPYALQIANLGWEKACEQNKDLKKGLNIAIGKIYYQPIADAFGMK